MIKVVNDKIIVDIAAVKAHLEANEDVTVDDGEDARNACRALQDIEKLFYGTPMGDLISEMMSVCDAITDVSGADPDEEDDEDSDKE